MSGFRPVPGTKILIDGTLHTVVTYDQEHGSVHLSDDTGAVTALGLEELVNHRHLRLPENAAKPSLGLSARIAKKQLNLTHERVAHVMEAETGFRSGDPQQPLPGEPRAEYDPATTTLTERRHAKAKELDNEFAKMAGLEMSYSTLRRWGDAFRSGGIEAVVDRRHVPHRNGRHSISTEVEEALLIVHDKITDGSNITMEGRVTLVKQYMLEHHGEEGLAAVPSRQTISRWFHDRFIPSELNGKSRTRASATTAPTSGFINANPTRVGELVVLDTYSLDVLLKGTMFEGLVSGSLVLGVDWFSRSVGTIRVVENAESSLDVTFAIRDLGRPKPMLPGWPDQARWPFLGIPESLVATGLHGDDKAVSGLPIVNAEALVVDHGPTYKAHVNIATARRYGASVLPARRFKPSDKAIVERFFRAIVSMLLQYLRGYRGSDPSERGKNVDDQVTWTAQELEDLISLWVVRIWQTHIMDGVRPPWCPEGDWSPNMLYQHAISTSGLPPRILTSNDYYDSLKAGLVKIDSRGVKVRSLWYDNPEEFKNMRRVLSPYGGIRGGKWLVRYDPRDMRDVYLLGEDSEYVVCRWQGATADMPCFTDRHVRALSRIRRERGLRPSHDSELTEILIKEILSVFEPTADWPKPKTGRAARSRMARNEELKRRDQASAGADKHTTPPAEDDTDQAPARSSKNALDQARARLRTQGDTPNPPAAPRLGTQRSALFGELQEAITKEETTDGG